MPMSVLNIPLFMKQNPTISITVLFYDPEEDEFGIRYSPAEVRKVHVNLLLISDDVNSPYLLIKAL